METNSSVSNYWLERTLQLELAMYNRGSEYLQTLAEAYLLAEKGTQNKIAPLYVKLANNNGVSLAEARKLLEKDELKEFKWSVDEYVEIGRKHSLDPNWVKKLENSSLKFRISRLEAMGVHMRQYAEVLMGKELEGVTDLMSDIYEDGFYKTGHMVHVTTGFASEFPPLNNKTVEKIMSKPWLPDGRNFSERIWGVHRPQLVNDLQTGLTQCIIRGESYKKFERELAKKYGVARHRAEALVRTESAYFHSVSKQESYKELGVEYQQFSATLDERTSEICQSMDRKIIRTCDIEIGRNAPPLHPRCRSVMVPYYEGNVKTRAARDSKGKTIFVDGNMSYKEWYDKFVKNKS